MFYYKNNELYVEDMKVADIALEFKTPLYIYSKSHFETQYKKLDEKITRRHLICFALKANSNLAVINTFAKLGAGADVVSAGEIFRAKKAGLDTTKIVFSGVGKTPDEIKYALENNILMFNIESFEELEEIEKVACLLNKTAPVSFRVNPNVDPKTHPYISTGLKKNKFGISHTQIVDAYKKASQMKHISIKGIQFHIGSQLTDVSPFFEAQIKVAHIMRELLSLGIKLDIIDIGGGLGVVYENEKEPDLDQYANFINEAFKDFPDSMIVLEPGRFLVANGGIFVTKVLYRKQNEGKNFIIVDGAMNDLIRPSLYDAYHKIEPVVKKNAKKITADIVGPICESGDFFARSREIESLERNDLVSIFSSGAYGFTMASNYNSRCKPAEVLVDKDKVKLVRARETFEDLIRGETI
ncbi:MAG: diaminopimelate decarboxylase [Desulfurella sp.]|uniref:diaminopimelate decarboxylase n=1 Tax=Desulfurella TaxID=33001 RepID=UPI0003E0BDD9|nr:diaminopimelate decarboxylase [Desulfurella multipotens]AHF96455.1 diaminopimelate decarboxylase [Desulfurella acetivorans A63]PMP66573.1 MAG: diaminopimelate decarboxylase [Desulfurella multipotens]